MSTAITITGLKVRLRKTGVRMTGRPRGFDIEKINEFVCSAAEEDIPDTGRYIYIEYHTQRQTNSEPITM